MERRLVIPQDLVDKLTSYLTEENILSRSISGSRQARSVTTAECFILK